MYYCIINWHCCCLHLLYKLSCCQNQNKSHTIKDGSMKLMKASYNLTYRYVLNLGGEKNLNIKNIIFTILFITHYRYRNEFCHLM